MAKAYPLESRSVHEAKKDFALAAAPPRLKSEITACKHPGFKKCHICHEIYLTVVNNIPLNTGFALRLRTYNNKVRIIILKNGEEYVCRIEALTKLKEFTTLKEGKIFKGRLQLYKEEGLINIIAKGEVAGVIEEDLFCKYLDSLER